MINIDYDVPINDDAIIGAGAKILGPITIGKQSRVGANAVVTRNVANYTTFFSEFSRKFADFSEKLRFGGRDPGENYF